MLTPSPNDWVEVRNVASKGTVVVDFPSLAVIVSIRVPHGSGVPVFHHTPGGSEGTGVELSDAIVTEQTQPKGQLEVSLGGPSEHTNSPA